MSYNVTYLKYGVVAYLTGMTITGTLIFLSDRERVEPQDVAEIVQGTVERAEAMCYYVYYGNTSAYWRAYTNVSTNWTSTGGSYVDQWGNTTNYLESSVVTSIVTGVGVKTYYSAYPTLLNYIQTWSNWIGQSSAGVNVFDYWNSTNLIGGRVDEGLLDATDDIIESMYSWGNYVVTDGASNTPIFPSLSTNFDGFSNGVFTVKADRITKSALNARYRLLNLMKTCKYVGVAQKITSTKVGASTNTTPSGFGYEDKWDVTATEAETRFTDNLTSVTGTPGAYILDSSFGSTAESGGSVYVSGPNMYFTYSILAKQVAITFRSPLVDVSSATLWVKAAMAPIYGDVYSYYNNSLAYIPVDENTWTNIGYSFTGTNGSEQTLTFGSLGTPYLVEEPGGITGNPPGGVPAYTNRGVGAVQFIMYFNPNFEHCTTPLP